MKALTILTTLFFSTIVIGCSSRAARDASLEKSHGPIMIKSVEPVYPQEAKRNADEGKAVVKMWVDSLGKVTMVFIQEISDKVFSKSVMDAAMATRFKPAKLDGKPIGVWLIAPFEVKKPR